MILALLVSFCTTLIPSSCQQTLVTPTSISDCQKCCSLADDGSFAVDRCRREGCNESESSTGSSQIAHTFLRACDRSKACEIGRDFRLLGSSALASTSPQRCASGVLEPVTLTSSGDAAISQSVCNQCCTELNRDYDFQSDVPPGFANDFTRARCADGCRRDDRCRDGAFYSQNRHRDRLGCALGLDLRGTGQANLRDLKVQCVADGGGILVASRDGRMKVSVEDCQACCRSLNRLVNTSRVSVDIGSCQDKGCVSGVGTSSCAAGDTGCEVGRDFVRLGSVRVDQETRGYCIGGAVETTSARPRTKEVKPSSIQDCKLCCNSIDERFDDAGSANLEDDFALESCQSGCENSQTCVSVLDVSSLENPLTDSNHRSRLGCAMGRELREHGVTILRDMAFQCNSDGSVRAVSYTNFESNVLGLEALTDAPSSSPSPSPTQLPSEASASPTDTPTLSPTQGTPPPSQLTQAPTEVSTSMPTGSPSISPTLTTSPTLNSSPSGIPSSTPTLTTSPTSTPTLTPTKVAEVNMSKSPTSSPTFKAAVTGSELDGSNCNSLSQSLGCVPEELVFIVYFAVFGAALLIGLCCTFAAKSSSRQTPTAALASILAFILATFALVSHVLVALELIASPDEKLFLLANLGLTLVAVVLLVNLAVVACVSIQLLSRPQLQPWFEENGVRHGLAMFFGLITVEAIALLASGLCGLTLPLDAQAVYTLRLLGLLIHVFGNIPQIIIAVLASQISGWTTILLISVVTSGCSLLYGILFGTAAVFLCVEAKPQPGAVKDQQSDNAPTELNSTSLAEHRSSSAVHLDNT